MSGWPDDHLHDVTDYVPSDVDLARQGVRAMLRLSGLDPDEPGVRDTPARVVKAWLEQTDRPGDPADLLAVTFTDAPTYDQLVAVGPVEFASVCEHHLLPFTGQAWVGYLPGTGGVVGLSKLARLVEHYARQPQIQERLTQQVTEALDTYLSPVGAGCVIRASHTCMSLRGVRKSGSLMTTSSLSGALRVDGTARAEFMALVGLS